MRTTSFLVAALVAASSVAAQLETKRIYYPRHIKREFTNITTTSDPPAPSNSENSITSQSTKRQDVQGDLGVDLDPPTPDARTTTVVVQSTVFVEPNVPTPAPFGRNGTTDDRDGDENDDDDNGDPFDPSPSGDSKPTASDTSETSSATDDPLLSRPPTGRPIVPTPNNSTTTSDPIISIQPTATESSATGITIGPIGIISETASSSTDEPTATPSNTDEPTETSDTDDLKTTPTPTRKGPLDSLTSALSEIVSDITSGLGNPGQNVTATEGDNETKIPTISLPTPTIPDVTVITPSVSPTIPTISPPIETTPSQTEPPVSASESTTSPPVSSTVTVDPPPASNTTEPTPPVSSTVSSTVSPTITDPPVSPSSTFTLGPTTNVTVTNTTVPAPTSTDQSTGLVTSIPHLGIVTNSQSWLPTTILVDPTSTTAAGLAPTTATGIPTSFPQAITPDTTPGPVPDDVELIQIGLLEGYNYGFVVDNTKVAAQIFNLLPKALAYSGGVSMDKIQMKKLVPLDTKASLGYMTTLGIVTYPKSMIELLKIDVKIPTSSLYNNPEMLLFNFTKQINPAIDITYGSYPDDLTGTGTGEAPSSGTSSINTDPFNNENPSGKSSTQQGATAGIVGGAVVVAAAYGAAMFIIARRYKRKKQSHRRASSISNPSDMQQSPRSSPALMGGALLSRDFTGYGGVTGGTAGGVAGGRNSHGSGRSGMGNSARTQYISAPVAAENSLGWN